MIMPRSKEKPSMALRSGAQLILQCERPDHTFECLGFAGIPIVNPVFIALACANAPQARADLDNLRQEFLSELRMLSPGVQPVALPCGGVAPNPAACHAHSESDCQKLLVLVGDDVCPLSLESFYQPWIAASGNYHVLPVFRDTAHSLVSTLLPAAFRGLNAEFWHRSIVEVVPAILGLSNLSAQNPRIFISYRQKDSSALAMQLFDALCHQGFDAFLDHFRIPPGVNFQAKLTQELGDKSMVLLIESEHILDSEWTTYEINVAKTCSLGVFALHVPAGTFVPGIDTSVRMAIGSSQFKQGSFSPDAELDEPTLKAVVDRIKVEHDRAFVRRRQILRSSLEGALLEQGVAMPELTPSGMLRVRSPAGIEYLVWLTPRPPELPDFHGVYGQIAPPIKGVVVGLSRLMEPVRFAQTGWLAGLSQILMVDEGHLKIAASKIARGVL
jgi:TIR domain